tara:strand:+ start:1552 stop:2508 length:957 start_codon:yes stop_codon:yes gene_type:complete
MLNNSEKKYLMKKLPKIELSYEKRLHKKVHTDLYLIIPKGKKYFAWFRHFNDKYQCFFFILSNNKRYVQDVMVYNCCFDKKLTIYNGTIVYGTIFIAKNIRFFSVEDVFYYKGKNVSNEYTSNKWKILKSLINNYTKPQYYSKNDIIFGLPIYETKKELISSHLVNLYYQAYAVQHRILNNSNHKQRYYYNESINIERKYEAVFNVKARINDDMYDLFAEHENKMVNIGIAYISNYNTSVFMNSIFRTIKENENLDALEESDDEEEFENISPDKFVNLKKECKIKCEYMINFKMWKPIKQVSSIEPLSKFKDVMYLVK